MKKLYSIIVFGFVILLLFSFFAFTVFAGSETTVDSEGWVIYTRLSAVTATYKINPGQNATYITKSFNDVPIPYGPKSVTIDDAPVENFWITTAIQNPDPDAPQNSSLVTVPPGESVVISTRIKIWNQYYASSESISPIDASLYECRVYLDDNYSRYLTPEVSASTNNGAELYYSFTNNTDSPVALSRVSIGMFEDSDLMSFGFQFYIGQIKYRMFTSSQQSTQAIVDSIQNQTDQITGSIDGLGDKLINGWGGESTPPSGDDVIADWENLEQELIAGAESGLSSIGDMFTDGTEFILSIIPAFTAVNTVFLSTIGVDVFTSIIVVSLAFGLFAFLLGVVPTLIPRNRNKGG